MPTSSTSLASLAGSLASLVFFASPAAAQTWEATTAFPTGGAPRLDCIGLVESGEILALAGSPYVGGPTGDSAVHGKTPGAANWSTHAPFEGPIIGQGLGIDAQGRIVVFGGIDGPDPEGDLGDVWYYDRSDGKVDTLPDRAPGAAVNHLAFASDDQHRVYSIGGDAFVVGGGSYSTLVQRYSSVTDAWQTMAPLPVGVRDAFAVNDGRGHILLIGGRSSSESARTQVLAYDVASNTWSDTLVPPLPVPRHSMRAALGVDGRLYVVGGDDGAGQVRAETWVLDLDLGTWTAGPALGVARRTFGFVLGPDARLYAMGGDDGHGGTNTVERLLTSQCPIAGDVPSGIAAWGGLAASMHVFFAGASPMTFRWEHDGVPIFDGPAPGGGTIVGADTDTLQLSGIRAADVGSYRLVATNACGTDTSDDIQLTLRTPAPLGSWASVQRLDGWGAGGVSASALDGTRIYGNGTLPSPPHGNQPRGIAWNGGGHVETTTYTPSNSAGSYIMAAHGGRPAGWWWWPYTTTAGTGYYQHACTWDPNTGALIELQPSGWEIGHVADTTGTQHIGSLRFSDESTNADAAYWPANQTWPIFLTPAGAWGSAGSGLDDEHQYGSTHIGFGVVHASRWSGSAISWEDWHPAGATRSYLSDGDDGLVIGTAYYGNTEVARIWGDGPTDSIEFLPSGATAATLSGTQAGYLLGSVTLPGLGSRAALWEGIDGPMVDLTAIAAPGGWTNVSVGRLDVFADGHVRVLGTGILNGVAEPLVWHLQHEPLAAEPTTISLASGGRHELYLATDASHAGELYLVVGSATGTSPGVALGGGFEVPIVPDDYTLWTLDLLNSVVLPGSLGLLDEFGGGHAALAVPVNAAPSLAGLSLHHAFLAWDGSGALSFVSNATTVALVP